MKVDASLAAWEWVPASRCHDKQNNARRASPQRHRPSKNEFGRDMKRCAVHLLSARWSFLTLPTQCAILTGGGTLRRRSRHCGAARAQHKRLRFKLSPRHALRGASGNVLAHCNQRLYSPPGPRPMPPSRCPTPSTAPPTTPPQPSLVVSGMSALCSSEETPLPRRAAGLGGRECCMTGSSPSTSLARIQHWPCLG